MSDSAMRFRRAKIMRRSHVSPVPPVERTSAGFTLIEMAVAVFIIALLLGSILVPLTTQVEQRQISDTQKTLEEIKEALIGFAMTSGYLPCPDKTTVAPPAPGTTPNDGQEDVDAAGGCLVTEGNVPWVTLGVANSDIWGNRLHYRVAMVFAQRAPAAVFTLATTSTIEVCTTVACAVRLTTVNDGPPALILSHGKNGFGAMNANSGTTNPNPTSLDEIANTNGDKTFVTRPNTAFGAAAGEFDDIVAWIPKSTLFNRMVAAGRLP